MDSLLFPFVGLNHHRIGVYYPQRFSVTGIVPVSMNIQTPKGKDISSTSSVGPRHPHFLRSSASFFASLVRAYNGLLSALLTPSPGVYKRPDQSF